VAAAGVVSAVGGVALASVGIEGARVPARLRTMPDIDATLVEIAPEAGENAPSAELSRQPAARNRTGAAPRFDSKDGGSYFVRLLLGAAFEVLAEDEHGLLDTEPAVVPLRELEPWGDESQARVLEREFDLTSIVTLDGIRIPWATGKRAGTTFLAAAGGHFYEVSLRAEPSATGDHHGIRVTLSRRTPGVPHTGRGETLEAMLVVADGHTAVLAAPGALLSGADAEEPFRAHTVFLVVSPMFDDRRPWSGRHWQRLIVEDPTVPPIPIAEVDPIYPDAARELGTTGTVRLRAVVRDDGSVDGVQVVSVPDAPGAEHLVAASAVALRQWRFEPARDRGRPVHSYVTIEMELPRE
jgi:TonB family protein